MNSGFKKILIISVLAIVCFFSESTAANDSLALCKFKVTYDKDFATLELEYTIKTNGKLLNDTSTTPQSKKDNTKGDRIQKTLYELILENPALEIKRYPDYIEGIIALIQGEKKKSEARKIYDNEHKDPPVKKWESSSFTMSDGVSSSSNTLTYSCKFKVLQTTTLLIPVFTFRSGKKMYCSEQLTVQIKKNA